MAEKQKPYQYFPQLFDNLENPQKEACLRLFDTYQAEFKAARGSSYNHQAWKGGYLDHIAETMNIGRVLYDSLNTLRTLPFSLSEALVVLFIHDLEKPWKHILTADQSISLQPELADKSNHFEFKTNKATEVGLVLTEMQLNALKYTEGEMDDYRREDRVMNELASFCHAADNLSARLWHDYPKNDDPWIGAKKHTS